nr:hypothetical protein [Tanacetum cinerariifolium]
GRALPRVPECARLDVPGVAAGRRHRRRHSRPRIPARLGRCTELHAAIHCTRSAPGIARSHSPLPVARWRVDPVRKTAL